MTSGDVTSSFVTRQQTQIIHFLPRPNDYKLIYPVYLWAVTPWVVYVNNRIFILVLFSISTDYPDDLLQHLSKCAVYKSIPQCNVLKVTLYFQCDDWHWNSFSIWWDCQFMLALHHNAYCFTIICKRSMQCTLYSTIHKYSVLNIDTVYYCSDQRSICLAV